MPKKSVKKGSRNKVLKRQNKIIELEKKQLKELDNIEKQIKQFGPHPLVKIGLKDVTRGIIGAFIGIVAHFAFIEGAHIAGSIDFGRATLLYLVSFILGVGLIYLAGFRKVKNIKFIAFLPMRVTLIYFLSLISIVFVLFLFNQIGSLGLLYKQVAVISLPAVIGAGAADLLGRE